MIDNIPVLVIEADIIEIEANLLIIDISERF